MAKLPFGGGVTHYDTPPPDSLGGDQEAALDELRHADRFRFANHLRAWIEVVDDRIVDAGYSGGGQIGSTKLALGSASVTVAAVPLPDVRRKPEIENGWARFCQTGGGRTGVPAPRIVKRRPFVQYHAPIAWSTLELRIHVDGSSESRLTGASPFPRHWVYDEMGNLCAKSGLVDFKDWCVNAFGTHTPWGDLDSPALVTAVETALERELSTTIMRSGSKPKIRTLRSGETLVDQGDEGDELFLLLDGVVSVEHDGVELGALGPGSVFGERAVLGAGKRTATLRAVTTCKVAVASGDGIDRGALAVLLEGHRREERQ